jgi:cytochrome aa3-600 menaquinol oxidase subunit 3
MMEHAHHHEEHDPSMPLEYQSEIGRLNILGFWIFLGAEIALFATLFATYFVLAPMTADGPLPTDLFKVEGVLIMTFLLLTSSFTCGLAIHELRRHNQKGVMLWTIITLVLGLGFIGFEIYEFVEYIHHGATMQSSAMWSGFFILAGTHGLHVTLGIVWITFILIQVKKRGLTPQTSAKLFISSLYWHFLDVIWIFIFTGVYLLLMMGGLSPHG